MTDDHDERPVLPVYVCSDDSEAESVIALLRDHGIEGIPSSELSHSVFPVTASELGQVTILVDEDKADKARSIIEGSLESGQGSSGSEE